MWSQRPFWPSRWRCHRPVPCGTSRIDQRWAPCLDHYHYRWNSQRPMHMGWRRPGGQARLDGTCYLLPFPPLRPHIPLHLISPWVDEASVFFPSEPTDHTSRHHSSNPRAPALSLPDLPFWLSQLADSHLPEASHPHARMSSRPCLVSTFCLDPIVSIPNPLGLQGPWSLSAAEVSASNSPARFATHRQLQRRG